MKHYYMFYKPYGCVTAHKDERYPVVMDYFRELNIPHLSPVGRLDRETEGLLLITDDGHWNQQLIHPDFHVPKTYEFMAMGTLDSEKLERLSLGLLLNGASTPTSGAEITVTNETSLARVLPSLYPEVQARLMDNQPAQPVVCGQITICEGKKRQIRRMLKAVGCYVIFLKRISVGDICLDPTLKPGEYKSLFLSHEPVINTGDDKQG